MKENVKLGLLFLISVSVVYLAFFKKDTSSLVDSHDHSQHTSPQDQAISTSLNNLDPAMNTSVAPELPKTSISFEKANHDFGKIKQNTENKYVFSFTNTGSEPLVISNAVGSCGCTVPTYPKEPIAPGKKGQIEVVYSPGKQMGKQTKTVSVTANTEPAVTQVNISAEVLEVK